LIVILCNVFVGCGVSNRAWSGSECSR